MNPMFDLTNLVIYERLILKHFSNIKNIDIKFERDPELGNYYFCFEVDVENEPKKLVDEMHKFTSDEIEFFTTDDNNMLVLQTNIIGEEDE